MSLVNVNTEHLCDDSFGQQFQAMKDEEATTITLFSAAKLNDECRRFFINQITKQFLPIHRIKKITVILHEDFFENTYFRSSFANAGADFFTNRRGSPPQGFFFEFEGAVFLLMTAIWFAKDRSLLVDVDTADQLSIAATAASYFMRIINMNIVTTTPNCELLRELQPFAPANNTANVNLLAKAIDFAFTRWSGADRLRKAESRIRLQTGNVTANQANKIITGTSANEIAVVNGVVSRRRPRETSEQAGSPTNSANTGAATMSENEYRTRALLLAQCGTCNNRWAHDTNEGNERKCKNEDCPGTQFSYQTAFVDVCEFSLLPPGSKEVIAARVRLYFCEECLVYSSRLRRTKQCEEVCSSCGALDACRIVWLHFFGNVT